MEEVDGPSISLIDLLQSTAETSRVPTPDFHSHSSSSYLDHLISLSLPSLLQEPASVSSETRTVENELTNLCFREYPTFISVHRCSSAVSSAFDDFSGSLGRLLNAVPALESECRAFSVNTNAMQAARSKAALVQEHQDKLVDLLEIPQLMDTCVRNGYYQEAMELASHTESLVRRYPSIPLVEDVAGEVESVLQLMLAQLLALLREPVKLPTLVKAVSFLRRLGTIAETELSIVFLASRLHNFRIQLVHIERDRGDPVRYVRKYIDVFREHVYDIISQFSTIFLDTAEPSILASFASQCVSDLVDLVSTYIPRISSDPASLSSILVQLGYCALSFSRVGLDFSTLIAVPFSSTALSAFSQSLSEATTALSVTLRNSAKTATAPSHILIAPEHISALISESSPPPPPTFTDALPPTVIAQYPPLALVMNAHLASLNSLRLLAPLYLYPQIRAIQSSSFIAITSSILLYLTEAVNLEIPKTDKPSHSRTPSSPRAHLLRRNTETQLAPEVRTARRRENIRVCVAFASIWVEVILPFLRSALDLVFEEVPKESIDPIDLETRLEELRVWIHQHGDKSEINGQGDIQVGKLESFENAIVEEPQSFASEKTNGSQLNGYTIPSSSTLDPPTSITASPTALPLSPSTVLEEAEPENLSERVSVSESPVLGVKSGASEKSPDVTEDDATPSINLIIERPTRDTTLEPVSTSMVPAESSIPSDPIDSMFSAPDGLSIIGLEAEIVAPLPLELEDGPSAEAEGMEVELEAVSSGVSSAAAHIVSGPIQNIEKDRQDSLDSQDTLPADRSADSLNGEEEGKAIKPDLKVSATGSFNTKTVGDSIRETTEFAGSEINEKKEPATTEDTRPVHDNENGTLAIATSDVIPHSPSPVPTEPASTIPSRAPTPDTEETAGVANGSGAASGGGGKKKKKKKKGKS